MKMQKETFETAVKAAHSVNELCMLLDRSKPSVYTYAYRFGVSLKQRWVSGIRKADGYYHYDNPKNHRKIAENKLGRSLLSTEMVHHIDFDKLHNEWDNFDILSKGEHQKAHSSLEMLARDFYKLGFIEYDREQHTYKKTKKGELLALPIP